MSTAQLAKPGAQRLATTRPAVAAPAARAPIALAAALMLVLLYAAFAHGAASVPAEARVQVAVAGIAALAGAAWVWNGSLRLAAPAMGYVAVGLLAAFAVWSGISLLWSVAPDQTWIELNRALSYVIVLCLAIALGATHHDSMELIAKGFLLIALAVTYYGLAQKLFPGLHLTGVFDLNQTGQVPRLQEPLGYWNALALFIGMGVPIALALAVDRIRTRRSRLGAIVALPLMFLAIGFTYSRGGVLALGLALVLGVALSGARLRSLMWLAVTAVATVPALVFGLTSHSLTAANVGLGHRELAGGVLAVILATSLIVLVIGSRKLITLEQTVEVGQRAARRIARRLVALGAVALAVAVLAVAFSSRGFGGTVSHAWKSFTATRGTSVYDPHRLLSADSENRWVWWQEAAGAFSDRPLTGWGAGSFPVTHLLYRRNTLSVAQPHSVPLQWLAETGALGALLGLGGYGLLLLVGARGVRRRAMQSERLLAAALLACGAAYAIHALYDWDWDIPGVTLPALVLLGVLVGSSSPKRNDLPLRPAGPGPGARAIALGALTLTISAFALSATLPSLASSKAGAALLTAAGSSPDALQRAQEQAALATSLDPLSDVGLRAQATIAVREGSLGQARAYLLDAVRRDPSDVQAWANLTYAEIVVGDLANGRRAAQRVLALDPRGRLTASFAGVAAASANLFQAPPKDSATAAPLHQP